MLLTLNKLAISAKLALPVNLINHIDVAGQNVERMYSLMFRKLIKRVQK